MNKLQSIFGGLTVVAVFLCCTGSVNAQLTTLSLTPTQDSYISSKLPSENYGTKPELNVSFGSRDGIFRSALKFDLSSIPKNAKIISAQLRLKPSVPLATGSYTTHKLDRFLASWTETGIRYNNQPGVATGGSIGVSTGDGVYRTFDVLSDVKNMIDGMYANEGWLLRLNNETVAYAGNFSSRENGTSANRPTLTIKYYLPINISSAVISHATNLSSADASITPTITGGSGSFTYQWINGTTGAVISTSSSLTEVAYGWYGLRIVDNTASIDKYMAFLVGVQCGTATIDFKPGPEYVDDALLYNLNKDGVNNGNFNFGGERIYITENWTNGSSWYNKKNLIKFNLWVDSKANFNTANLYLYGGGHDPLSRPNTSELRYVKDPWFENSVTYNTAPSINPTPLSQISGTSTANENRVLDISDFWELWKTDNTANHGMMMQLQSYTDVHTRMYFFSSDIPTPSSRPWIQFEINLEDLAGCPSITPSWDENSESGTMDVDITSYNGEGAPYKYMISTESIPELSESYSFIHDSLGFDIDSTQFFSGTETSQIYQFQGLDAGRYFISVFDNAGTRILNRSKQVQGPLSFDQQTGLSISGNQINATSANGAGSLKLYMSETTEYSSFETTLKSLTTNGEQFIGLATSTSAITNYQNLAFGFRIQGTSLYSVKNGVSTLLSGVIAGDVLEINQKGSQLKLLKNNSLVVTEVLPTTFSYKLAIGTQPGAVLDSKYSGKLTPKPYTFKPVIVYFDCENTTTPSFRFKLTKVGTTNWTSANYSITNAMTGEFLASGSLPANASTINFTTLQNSLPLSPGYYIITITGINSQTYTEEIYLGYPTEWETIDAYYATNAANSYSTLANNVINNNYQFAKSKNIMKPSDPSGFIEFTPLTVTATSLSANLLRFTTQNINMPVPTSLPSSENLIVFYRQGTQLNAIVNIGNTLQLINSLPINSSMKVRVLASTIEFKYGNTIQSYPRNGFTGMIRCQSNKNGFGFRDVISSFPCKEESDLHAKLKYEIDGFYHIMKNGKIKFVFDQEYDASNLSFNIYNQMDVLVRDQTDFPALSTTYGKNYLTIDASLSQYCLGKGFFYLEVVNNKKEKQYLRFFNDFTVSPCDDYVIEEPNGPGN